MAPRIYLLILLYVVHRFNCLQRSDWTYDRETDLLTFTTNGTTHSCRSEDFFRAVEMRKPNTTLGGRCAADDPSRHQIEVLASERESSRNVSIPSAEEILDRIVKVFRSWSLDDNPATNEWYDQAMQNLTQMNYECRRNNTTWTPKGSVSYAIERAMFVAQLVGHDDLPRLRNNALTTQVALDEAIRQHGADVGNLTAVYPNEHLDRERLYTCELNALTQNYEDELKAWYDVAKYRTQFVKDMARNLTMEHPASPGALKLVETRMNLLYQMALANQKFALIDYIVRFVAIHTKFACLSSEGYDQFSAIP